LRPQKLVGGRVAFYGHRVVVGSVPERYAPEASVSSALLAGSAVGQPPNFSPAEADSKTMSSVSLSICVATMGRPVELTETIVALLGQIDDTSTEIVVVDATAPSNRVEYAWRADPRVRLIELDTPSGVDRDYDRAVRAASGRYCWLLPDDDRIRPGALRSIHKAIGSGPSVVLLNTSVWGPDLADVLVGHTIPGPSRVVQGPVGVDDLAQFSALLTYIGCIVIDRNLWCDRIEDRFFGSEFAHVGVLAASPLPGSLAFVADPYIDIRYGVSLWQERAARVWCVQWPALVDAVVTAPQVRGQFYSGSTLARWKQTLRFRALRAADAASADSIARERPFTNRAGSFGARTISRLPVSLARFVMTRVAGRGTGDPLLRLDLALSRRAIASTIRLEKGQPAK
jgi:Glycosyl transferase family 2